jgi:glycerophosphoryl diester phosphodiesterase
MFRTLILGAVLATALTGCASAGKTERPVDWQTLDGKPPLVIAHRGASGYRPEHTLEAYALAIDQGADVVEPDLVFTKDGVLVARHDRYLSTTTDVADHPVFAERKRANNDPADAPRDDWWVEDFTLAELRTLRARQPFPGRSKEFDGFYEIPTFAEILHVVSRKAKDARRPVGVYPETKHPAFFASIGRDFEAPLLAALEGFGAGPVFIQSFEPEILKRLKGKTSAKLVQLVYEDTPGAGPNIPLAEIAAYADGVGPAKQLILRDDRSDTGFAASAHSLRLIVHAWTIRDDDVRRFVRPPGANDTYYLFSTKTAEGQRSAALFEMQDYFNVGVDGVFADFTDSAIIARDYIPARMSDGR